MQHTLSQTFHTTFLLPPPLREVEISSTLGNVTSRNADHCIVTSVLQLMSQWFAVAANENVPLTSCDHRKRDKLQETFPSVLLFRNETFFATKIA